MSQPQIIDLSSQEAGYVARAIDDGITAFNSATRPDPSAGPLVLALHGDDGSIIGGIRGRVAYGWLRIDLLWVSEAMRGSGYGSLLLKAAEKVAFERGCHSVHLDTHEFQAPEFYRSHGYEVFGELDDYPDGEKHLYFKKHLRVKEERA